ncbi:MAG: tetratricopeptide repeat protein [Verrucomicrobiales bacterium]
MKTERRLGLALCHDLVPQVFVFGTVLLGPCGMGAESHDTYARGVLEETRGGDAAEWFERAFDQDPDAWPLAQRVAVGRWQRGDLEGASTVYREFAQSHPERLEVQVAYADFLRESSPHDDFAAKLAGEVLEDAMKIHGDSLPLIQRLFRSYEQRGMREQSLELFERVVGRNRVGAVLAAAEMANTLFSADDEVARGKIDEVFRGAMSRHPDDPSLARAASEHFRKTGRVDDAVEMLRRHVDAAPTSLALRVRLGVLYFAAEDEEAGQKCLLEVLDIDPQQALAHQALAKFYRSRNEFDRARPHAVEMLKIRGGDSREFHSLAEELLELGRPREARLLLEKGIFDHPDNAEIATLLAVATWRDETARSRAMSRFRQAESLSGLDGPAADPKFQLEFAEYLVESGDIEAAEGRLRTAIKTYPAEAKEEMASAMRKLAKIWLDEGRNESAARALLKRADALHRP